MKVCPTCRKQYTDDGLNFCLEDGSVLTAEGPNSAPTVVMSPRGTDGWGQSPAISVENPAVRATQPGYTMQPPAKTSRVWMWAVGILGLALLMCGGGGAGLLFLASLSDSDNKTPENRAVDARPAPPAPSRWEKAEALDLSKWEFSGSEYGRADYDGSELVMAAKGDGYYYVLVATGEYQSDKAATRVTVRNIQNRNTNLGYGLIVHSETTPLVKDIALLIDAKKRMYRVVRHEASKETALVPWTVSEMINEGTNANTLEARDNGANIDLYINDQLATSVKNPFSSSPGVPGLYAGDAVRVGFKRLEISR